MKYLYTVTCLFGRSLFVRARSFSDARRKAEVRWRKDFFKADERRVIGIVRHPDYLD